MSETITAQELFTQVVTAVVAQGQPSVTPGTTECLYRSPEGLKCAAGHALTDEEYETLGGAEVNARTFWEFEARLPHRLSRHFKLIVDLQRAHDGNAHLPDFVSGFRHDAQDVADTHRLTMPVLP